MTPQTPEQILTDLAAEIQADWGPTPLQDPVANRSDNLVRLVSHWAVSISDLQWAFEAFIQRNNIAALEGELLTAAAAVRGITRKTGALSKTTIMVTGLNGTTLPAGSELMDRFGMNWITQSDIKLSPKGAGCAFGQGVACAETSGSFTLFPGELRYDNIATPYINAATNGIMLEIGGEQESDDALRNRILNRGPLSLISGTSDAALSAIYAVDGVNFARYEQVETCDGSGWMFVVHGGNDAEICEAIKRHAGLGVCALLGDNSCESHCADVHFQRACPVLTCLKITLSCDCPEPDENTIKSQILSAAPSLALENRITAKDIARLSDQIIKVEFSTKKRPLYACIDQDTPTIIDPVDDTEIPFASTNPCGICAGVIECAENEEFLPCAQFHPWEYPIIDAEYITVERDCSGPVLEC